jgi:hypothetical protein
MTKYLFAPLPIHIMSILALSASVSCGEKPSFVDRYKTLQGDSLDSLPQSPPIDGIQDIGAIQQPGGPPPPGISSNGPLIQSPSPLPPTSNPGNIPDLPPEGTPNPMPPPGPNPEPPMPPPPPSRRTVKTEATFPAYLVEDAAVEKEFGNPLLLHQFTMLRPDISRKKTMQQVLRPAYMDRFEQVPTGTGVTERFGQVVDRALDILMVVDDSPSMKDNQENLSTKLSALLSSVEKTNWAIGVTTTGCQNGCLRSLIKKGDADAKTRFAAAVLPGTHGNWVEKGILNAVNSLSSQCMTEPWLRENSTLAVVFVSDEDNCSNGRQCGNKPHSQASYLLNFLASIREPGKNARVYGIIWHPNIPEDQCKQGKYVAKTYAQLISATKGTYGNICANDYTQALNQISKDMLESLNSQFMLKYEPDPQTLRVFVNNVEVKQGITIQGKTVTITPPPPEGSSIAINYRYDVKPPQTSFKLRFNPYDGKAMVTVNGLLVPPTDYVINPGQPVIDFIIPPPVSAKITVAYYGEVQFKQGFSVGEAIKPGTLKVKVNGIDTMDYVVAEEPGIITFNTPPPEGATVEFSYAIVGNPLYQYPYTAPPGTPPDLDAFDTITLVPIRITYANGIMTVNADDYIEGRKVTVRFKDSTQKTYDILLPQAPLNNSIRVSSGTLVCPPSGITIVGSLVNVKNCNFPDNVGAVRVDYQFIAASYTEFTLKLEKIPAPTDYQVWTVWVNDVVVTNYTRNLNVIKFPSPLPFPSTVRIQLIQDEF